ncbi:Cleft lip and palate transmembrane protein 1 like protein [Saguinus oedipus]|uniref:Cleft lip and palate transmembrane protein 1 like protein n=1 Tax=Saguinus oedipus TaxID=9490 RepID=A0ABQ9TW82_SAGOE|nr:Cleft lip and palate transmembrane protein 1 like protein [Saguinus oedipus]
MVFGDILSSCQPCNYLLRVSLTWSPGPRQALHVLSQKEVRIFIIWAISSWFRRGPAPQDQAGPGGAPRVASRNLFPKDTLMNLHVYISEHEHFTDFNATSALFWEQHDLVYGDWTSGENSDGCYEHFAELDIPQSLQWCPRVSAVGTLHSPRGVLRLREKLSSHGHDR